MLLDKTKLKSQDHEYPTRYSVIRCRTAKGCMAAATRLNKSQSLNKGKNCSTLRVEGSPLFRFQREGEVGGGGGVGEGRLHVYKG